MWGLMRVNKFRRKQKADLCHYLAARGPAIALSNTETRLGIQASILDVLQALWSAISRIEARTTSPMYADSRTGPSGTTGETLAQQDAVCGPAAESTI